MREICEGICRAHGAECAFEYTHEFAPLVNWPQCVPTAVAAARAVVGDANVDDATPPLMASEDFGVFLQALPGAFVFIGNQSHKIKISVRDPQGSFADFSKICTPAS